jgi:O-antigen/teichoic acid export membrane protein
MSLTARWATLATLPIVAIFLFWGAQLTLLFGDSFAVSQAVVAWLAAGQFVVAVLSRCGWALSMTGRHLLELKILSAGFLTAVLLSSVAVPAYGQLGAAVATCASVAITNVARLLFVSRALGAFPLGRDIVVITAAGIALAWASSAVVAELPLTSFWSTSCGIACFLVAYGISSWMGLLNELERHGIRRALRHTGRAAFRSAGA